MPEDQPVGRTRVGGAVTSEDVAFLVGAHRASLAGRAAGRVAVEHAASDEVRRLGRLLLDDHTALDAGVASVADDLGVALPDEPSAEQHDDLTRAVAQSGIDFDAAWLAAQILGARETLALGERVRERASHADVRGLAEAAAPVLAHHRDRAVAIAGTLGVPMDVEPQTEGAPAGTDARIPSRGGRAAGAGVPAAGSRGGPPAGAPDTAGSTGLLHRATEAARRLDARSAVVGLAVGLLLGRRSRRR